MSGQAVAAELSASMKKYRDVLRNNEEADTAFKLMEEDLQQVNLLDKTCHLLINALNVLSDEYHLLMQCNFESVDAILTVCEMLLEKRKLTDWYFSETKPETLLQYVTELRNKLHNFTEQKKILCKRYSAAILEEKNIQQLLTQLVSAEAELRPLISDGEMTYSTLCDIVSFDPGCLQSIEAALNHYSFAAIHNNYGLPNPVTLQEVQTQISAIEKAKKNKVVTSWHSAAGRSKAKMLLQDVMGKAEKLTGDKEKLKALFQQFGIIIDIDSMSEADLAKLEQADNAIPEAAVIVPCCNNDSAYSLLDEIDQNKERFSEIAEKINLLRIEYRIVDTLDDFELLAVLRTFRDTIVLSAPCSSWATSKDEAFDVLRQVMEVAGKLKLQRNQLLETCEETVFALDYTGILNRFKTEYTNFFKIFKSSYKEDTKQIRLVFKEVRKKIPDEEIITLLHALRQYNEDLRAYQGFSAQVAKLFDIQEYELEFDWESVKKRLDTFDALGHLFQDDLATYHFVSENCWSNVYDVLVAFDDLNTWFRDNEDAKRFYAGLYLGIETDTAQIRDTLYHACNISTIFASSDRYIEYMVSDAAHQDGQKAKKCAADIVAARAWFASQADEVKDCTGIVYDENFDEWTKILSQLELFSGIVADLGENSGYVLVSKYSVDKTLIDEYLEVLKQITQIANFAQSDHHTAANHTAINAADIRQLIDDIRTIIANAELLQSVYTNIYAFCHEGDSALSLVDIKSDLNAILLYQHTRDDLSSIENEAREKVGEAYRGLSTDWDAITSAIIFSNKVIRLLSGNISTEMKAAFVSGEPLYSDAQVAELRSYLRTATEIEATFPILGAEKNLNAKLEGFADLCAALRSAIRIKDTIASAAYSEGSYSAIIADFEKTGSCPRKPGCI